MAAPCHLGCAPVAAVTAAYETCLSTCPPPGSSQVTKAVEDLIACGSSACSASLTSCAATASQAAGSCSQNDLACYANLPACATAYAACFNP
ncbi:MAG: hypothetical protein HY902_01140 [Deltaproteobacteria bacterium]|nr:hypothetical protein [Deltaproteobacteria bacterium]